MKPKTMILMVVAVGCGLAASYMTSKLLAERNQPKEEEKVKVLVAKAKVPRFTILKEPEKFFEVRELPKSAAPRSYFTDPREVKDKRVNKEIKVDVHISEEDVQTANTALPIPDGGYVGLGVTVNAASTVGYFVNPGDKVDVILTQRGPNPTSQTILREVLVLAVGQQNTRTAEGPAGSIQANTVSVALTPEEAQLLRLAETQGDLSLLLRKDGDLSKGPVKPATLSDLKKAGFNVASFSPPTRSPGDNLGRDSELPPIPKTPETKKPDKPETKVPDKPKTQPEIKTPDKPKTKPEAVASKPETPPEEDPVEEPRKAEWITTIEAGAAPAKRVHWYRRPDGSFTKDEADPELEDGKAKKKADPKAADPK
jgi:pilus assembly protein CpaB